MYSGEFDGAAGGFMLSLANTAPDPSSSSSRNHNNVRTLLPMTVKQISDISSNDESSATIDGLDVSTVTLLEGYLRCKIKNLSLSFLLMMAQDELNAGLVG